MLTVLIVSLSVIALILTGLYVMAVTSPVQR